MFDIVSFLEMMITTQRIFILQKLKKNLLNLILPFIKYSYNTDRNVYVYTDKFEKKKKSELKFKFSKKFSQRLTITR